MSSLTFEELKDLAKELNIQFNNAIGEQKLLDKVEEYMTSKNTTLKDFLYERYIEKLKHVSLENAPEPDDPNKDMKLRRVKITCNDPSRSSKSAITITVANSGVLCVTKCIPLNVPTHIPEVIYNVLKDTKYQKFVNTSSGNSTDNITDTTTVLVDAYSIETLPPLTKEEYEAISHEQLARK